MCFMLHLPAPPLLLLRLSMAGQPQRLWLEPLLGQAAVGRPPPARSMERAKTSGNCESEFLVYFYAKSTHLAIQFATKTAAKPRF